MTTATTNRSCPVCGALVPGDVEFCGNCGTYLGWLTPPTTEPSPAAPEAAAPSLPAAPAVPTVPAAPAVTGEQQPATERPEQPTAVQPAKPVAPRPQRAPTVPTAIPNGLACRECGALNDPSRSFCRQCTAPLRSAASTPDIPWWRRLRLPRRRGGSGRLARRLVLALVLVALVVAGIALYPLGVRLVQDVLDKTGTAEPAPTTSVRAGAEVPGHPAAAVVDGVSNRYWGAPAPGSWVEVTFGAPIRLLDVLVHTGASDKPTEFPAQARPVLLDLVVTTADGQVSTISSRLADRPGPQQIDTAISDVVRVRVVEREIAGAGPGRHVALGELEFFRRG